MAEPEPEVGADAGLADVFVTTAVRTSAGPGPGHLRVPLAEAQAIVNTRRGVFGDRPPRGYADGGCDPRDAGRMRPRTPGSGA